LVRSTRKAIPPPKKKATIIEPKAKKKVYHSILNASGSARASRKFRRVKLSSLRSRRLPTVTSLKLSHRRKKSGIRAMTPTNVMTTRKSNVLELKRPAHLSRFKMVLFKSSARDISHLTFYLTGKGTQLPCSRASYRVPLLIINP
jgi:hypothetical protein